MKYFLIFIVALPPLLSSADALEKVIKKSGLVKQQFPKANKLDRVKNSDWRYCVSKDKDKIKIQRVRTYCSKHKLFTNTKRGKFVGTDNGEWGGELSVVFPSGKSKTLLHKNILNLQSDGQFVYVFTGISHLSAREGAIYRVNLMSKNMKAERLTLLPSTPFIIIGEPIGLKHYMRFYLFISDCLISFSPYRNGDLRVEAKFEFPDGIYPSSAVKIDNKMLVGLTSGVAVIELQPFIVIKKIDYYAK